MRPEVFPVEGQRTALKRNRREILHDRVLGPLGVEERVLPLRLPVEVLTAACDADDGLLVTLAPPTLGLLIDVADRGEVMPPKTTYFDPKPCAGIFLRS